MWKERNKRREHNSITIKRVVLNKVGKWKSQKRDCNDEKEPGNLIKRDQKNEK